MKLFYMPGACSLSPHIVAREAGLPLELERVDYGTKRTETGADFMAVNPKGYVPALRLDDGETLTEGLAIVQYLADLAPESRLAPPNGSLPRYRLQEWLAFIATELHKGFGPLFAETTPPATKQAAKDALARRFTYLDQRLAGRDYLMGSTFTVADAYAFTVLNWTQRFGIDLEPYPNLRNFMARVAGRPAVREAMKAEGILENAA